MKLKTDTDIYASIEMPIILILLKKFQQVVKFNGEDMRTMWVSITIPWRRVITGPISLLL